MNDDGAGLVGLSHAFLLAGGRSVLASLWRVGDRPTALLMRRFYENLLGAYSDVRRGRSAVAMTKAEALREATLWLRALRDAEGRHPYEHPSYWAAFRLLGDPG